MEISVNLAGIDECNAMIPKAWSGTLLYTYVPTRNDSDIYAESERVQFLTDC